MTLVVVLGSLPLSLFAHDTGFGHSERTLYVSREGDGYRLEYRIRMPVDEALIEMAHIDVDHDGQVSTDERDAWFTEKSHRIASLLYFSSSDRPKQSPAVVGYRLDLGNQQTFIFHIASAAPSLTFEDGNFTHKAGQIHLLSAPDIQISMPDGASLFHADFLTLTITTLAPPPPPPAP